MPEHVQASQSQRIARLPSAVAWFRVPAVLFAPVPLLVPLYQSGEPLKAVLCAVLAVGCIASFTWFFKTKGVGPKLGVGALLLWYVVFAVGLARGLVTRLLS